MRSSGSKAARTHAARRSRRSTAGTAGVRPLARPDPTVTETEGADGRKSGGENARLTLFSPFCRASSQRHHFREALAHTPPSSHRPKTKRGMKLQIQPPPRSPVNEAQTPKNAERRKLRRKISTGPATGTAPGPWRIPSSASLRPWSSEI